MLKIIRKTTAFLDRTDKKLVSLLQQNARISNADLAKSVHLSPTPCLRRVRELETVGVITAYRATVDRRKLGYDIRAFIGVTRDKSVDRRQLWQHMTVFPEIMGCYVVSGEFDLLLDVIAKDLDSYSNSLLEKILSVPGVVQVRSMFVLREVTSNLPLPLES
jgi:Lrp/AsnC family transcriptional regulator, leucine-responsive regulatory protein